MFKIDLMSSLREGKVNGFDLAMMEQIEEEGQEQEELEEDIDLEETEEDFNYINANCSSDYEDVSYPD